jgi:Zn-dependent peptidase ImmA (M78 family)
LLVRLLGLDGLASIEPEGALELIGVYVLPLPKGKVEGYFDRLSRTVYVDLRLDERDLRWVLAHEIGHIAMLRWGCALPHNDDAVNRVARAIIMPRWFILWLLRQKISDDEIVGRFPRLRPELVRQRLWEVRAGMLRTG